MGTISPTIENADRTISGTKLFAAVRHNTPLRKLGYYEHLQLAERQATRLHTLLGEDAPAADLGWATQLQNLTVVLQPRWRMDGLAGLSSYADGHWVIGINKNDAQQRRRFTLAHELKHVLDASRDRVTYAGISDKQRELIADYFAACYLMPKLWLRRVWSRGLQDPSALAEIFNVSLAAMTTRLRYLGYLDEEQERPLATYFRSAGVGTQPKAEWPASEWAA